MILLPLNDTAAATPYEGAGRPACAAPSDSAASASTGRPCAAATAAMRVWSATLPSRSTGTIAATRRPSATNVSSASASRSGSMFPVSSQSTNTGSAPV